MTLPTKELSPATPVGVARRRFDRQTAARLAAAGGPAAVTLYLAFNAGGFFAGAPAVAATVLGIALMLRITLAEEPFAGFGPWLVAAAVALGLFAAWTLASALWSDAPAQAMIEFDRALLYWLALVLFGSLPWSRRTLLWAMRALAAAVVLVAVVGLATRLAPDVWSAPAALENDRLSYPLTYWNALGVLAAIGIVLCVSCASRREEPRLAKVLGSAALPVLAVTLYFTFSRGSIAAAVVGLLAFAILARPRGLASAALATVPPTVVAIVFCYQADLLSSANYAIPAGVDEGHRIALILVACAVAAGLTRLFLLSAVDSRLDRFSVSARSKRLAGVSAALGVALALLVAVAAFDAPGRIGNEYSRFVNEGGTNDSGDLRSRLTNLSNNHRLDQYRVAIDALAAHPLTGEGAGTYARVWAKNGTDTKIEDAHSLYFEALAELGLSGLILLLVALACLFGGLVWNLRGTDRAIYGTLIAAGLAWALHAGVDWDWEMPVTGLWFFALGGMAIRRRAATRPLPVPGRLGRAALGIGCLALVVTPALMALSQNRLNSAVQALGDGDCRAAAADALSATRFVSARPEPYEVIGFCDSRSGENRLAVAMLRTAVARDPGVWEPYYGLALVRAAAGKDPRPAARKALELAPHEPLARDAARRFRTADPRKWRRRALNARLPIY